MIGRTNSLLAALLSIPPVLLVAALAGKLLPPAPGVPSVVAANDRRIDATNPRSKSLHREKWSGAARPFAFRYETGAR